MSDLTDRAKARIQKVIDQIRERLSDSEIAEFRAALEDDERAEQERVGGA